MKNEVGSRRSEVRAGRRGLTKYPTLTYENFDERAGSSNSSRNVMREEISIPYGI